VDVGVHPARKSVWKELPQEVDQVWAEAYIGWMLGEPLYLSEEEEKLAEEMQENHREASGKEGMILDFLEKKIPSNWDSLSLTQRRQFWNGTLATSEDGALVEREKVCAIEVWTECFGGDAKYMKKTESREINSILERQKGWKRNKSVRRYGPHGTQKGFEKM
jgi:predicted P-loop ATPase